MVAMARSLALRLSVPLALSLAALGSEVSPDPFVMRVRNQGADEMTLVVSCEEKYVAGAGKDIMIPSKTIVKKQYCLVPSSSAVNCKEPCTASYFVETTPGGEPTATLGFGHASFSTTNDGKGEIAQDTAAVMEHYKVYSSPSGVEQPVVDLTVSKTPNGATEALLVLSDKFSQEAGQAQVSAQDRGGWRGCRRGGWRGCHRQCRRICNRWRCWWQCW